jgi:hypothetical protein
MRIPTVEYAIKVDEFSRPDLATLKSDTPGSSIPAPAPEEIVAFGAITHFPSIG